MTIRRLTEQKQNWSDAVRPVYRQYPAAIRSSNWLEIVRLCNAGEVDAAMELAKEQEQRSPQIRAENVIYRRIRVQRVQLLAMRNNSVRTIRAMFRRMAENLKDRIERLPNGSPANLRKASDILHDEIVLLRQSLKSHLTDIVWQSIVMGVRQMGEAIKPIFRANQESFADELADLAYIEHPCVRDLMEARLSFGISRRLAANAKTSVSLRTDKWFNVTDRIYRKITANEVNGLKLSDRIWDLTWRAEMDIRRALVTDLGSGELSPREVADRIVRNVYVEGIDSDFQSGPGIYKSPMANAMRVARTELGRAYSQASAAWAKGKPWIKGLRIVLSDVHEVEDECDKIAGDRIYTADEVADILPIHPHCMCHTVYVIDEDYLTKDEAA